MTEHIDLPSFDQGGRVAAALERIADVQEGKTSSMSTLEQQIATNFIAARTGKVYRTRVYKFATNNTTAGVKMDDNAGLTCEASTDTVEGQDDYADIPMFTWMRCNYTRDDDGFARPSVLKGMPGYKTSGAVDIGTLHPLFYWNHEVHATYEDWIVSDYPHPELGLVPWKEAVKGDGTIMPYWIESSGMSVIASDGLLRSQPGVPAHHQSFNGNITSYQKKGTGYHGAKAARQLYAVLMYIIKYGGKSSQTTFKGCTDFDSRVKCAVAETGVKRVIVSSSSPWYVGCCVSVGTANGTSIDRENDSMNAIADRVRVESIETVTIDSTDYTALNLDVDSTFDTTTDTYVSTMPCFSFETDAVIGHHDGSYLSNTDGHHVFRIQGQEYENGQWICPSDVMIEFNADGTKKVRAVTAGSSPVADSSDNTEVIGEIPISGDFWIGDISTDAGSGVFYPTGKGTGDSVGYGDLCWGGGTPSAGALRQLLMGGGNLWDGSTGGLCYVNFGAGLGNANWYRGSAD